ncbi:MAG TPA: hypothetical protein VKB96_12915, partial [Gammaproteobacteria bacterium]|nr:hypothetical protein [Gammaproteobacteria bacterium]
RCKSWWRAASIPLVEIKNSWWGLKRREMIGNCRKRGQCRWGKFGPLLEMGKLPPVHAVCPEGLQVAVDAGRLRA